MKIMNTMKEQTQEASMKVSMAEKIGYSMGDGSANLVFQMMMMFQLFFYTDVFGIKATAAGMILLVARIFDAFVDPMVGILSDRTETRWGKYRPWVLWTALPFAVFFVLAFSTPDLGERGKILYAGATYIILMSIYSFNNTPYSSIGGVMTSDIKERTSIASVRFVTATIATFVVQGLTLPLVAKFGQGNAPKGWHITIALFAIVGFGLMIITFFSCKERIKPVKNQKTSVKQDFHDLVGSRPWKAMFILTIFLFTTLAMWGSSMSYYFKYVVDKQSLYDFLSTLGLTASSTGGIGKSILDAFGLIVKSDLSNVFAVGFSLFNMAGQLVTLVGVILLSGWLSGLFGKRNVFIVCLALTALFTSMFFVVGSKSITVIFIINLLKSISYAPTIPLLWAMMGDVADYNEWQYNRRATGFTFAGIVFALKAGLGIGGAICGKILDSFGFVANAPQQLHSSIVGIRLTLSLIPAVTFAIGVLALFFYPISKKSNQNMQKELTIRRGETK